MKNKFLCYSIIALTAMNIYAGGGSSKDTTPITNDVKQEQEIITQEPVTNEQPPILTPTELRIQNSTTTPSSKMLLEEDDFASDIRRLFRKRKTSTYANHLTKQREKRRKERFKIQQQGSQKYYNEAVALMIRQRYTQES